MNDKHEIKLHSDKLYVETEQDSGKTIINIKAKDSLEDEAFDREFDCCKNMKRAKPEPAPHPELLPVYDDSKLRESIKKATETWAKVGRTGNPDIAIASRLRKERDDLKERCSDLDLQVDSLEAQVSKLKLENVTLKGTVTALKECESVKGQVSEPAEWNGEGLPPVGCECEFMCSGFWGDDDYHWCVFMGLLTDKSYAIEFHHYTSPDRVTCGCFDPCCTSFRPIESPKQKAQREREDAAYDLYLSFQEEVSAPNPEMGKDEFNGTMSQMAFLAVVDKTGYRKQT